MEINFRKKKLLVRNKQMGNNISPSGALDGKMKSKNVVL